MSLSRRNFLKKVAVPVIGFSLLNPGLKAHYRKAFAQRMPASAKERIENALAATGSAQNEVAFAKWRRAGSLENITKKSRHNAVEGSIPLGSKSSLHNHPFYEYSGRTPDELGNMRLNCLASIPDLRKFLKNLSKVGEANTLYLHIAVNDLQGKVIGYTTLYATKKFIDNYIFDEKFRQQRQAAFSPYTAHSRESTFEFYNVLKRNGLKIRYTPMPGYRVEEGIFVKK